MRVKLPLVICHDGGHEEPVTDVITVNKNNRRIEHLGLPLAAAKHLLRTLQRPLLHQQITTLLDPCADGPDCGTPLKLKARAHRSFRTLFGTLTFQRPRLEQGDCQGPKTSSCRPLAALLTEAVAPECLQREAQWSARVSQGMRLDALQDFLPLARTLDVKTVRSDTRKVAKRLEAELGEERSGFIEGAPRAWALLPTPEGFFTVGLDGGEGRHGWDKKQHVAVIVGTSLRSFAEEAADRPPSLTRWGFVQTLDTKPQRRLYEVLPSQDCQMNPVLTFLSDGDDTRRALQREMRPKATQLLDWFHRTMQRTVLGQFGKGLVPGEAVLGEPRRGQMERLQGSLGHGQVEKALGKSDELETSSAPCEETYARFPRLLKALAEVRPSIVHNRHVLPHDGERYHHGEALATGFVESTVNEVVRKRFCQQHQMQWSQEGAHWLLQTRGRTRNGAWGAIFKHWQPDIDLEVEESSVAA